MKAEATPVKSLNENDKIMNKILSLIQIMNPKPIIEEIPRIMPVYNTKRLPSLLKVILIKSEAITNETERQAIMSPTIVDPTPFSSFAIDGKKGAISEKEL